MKRCKLLGSMAAVIMSAVIIASGCGQASSGSAASTAPAETAAETVEAAAETVDEEIEPDAESDEEIELEEESDEEEDSSDLAGDADLETVISSFLDEAGAVEGGPDENLEAAYRFLLSESEYLGVGTPDFEEGWQEQYALDMFEMKMGNCFSFASAFAAIAEQLGFPASIVTGSSVWGEEDLPEHSWVLIDDKVCDPLLEDRLDDGSGQLHFFMTDYDTLKNEQSCSYTASDVY